MPSKDELPQELTDRIATEENTVDRQAILGPIKRGAQYMKDKILGTDEQNAEGQAMLDKQARKGSGLAKALGGKGMKKGGSVSKADMQKAGFYDKDKTKSERQAIVSKVTTKPQRVAIVEKAFSTKNMKSGGSVSTASKRADGCAIRGKTRA